MKYVYTHHRNLGIGDVHNYDGLLKVLSWGHGWMSKSCKENDEKLLIDIKNMEVGDIISDRLGAVIRLKDS